MENKKKKSNSFFSENKSLLATIPIFIILIGVVLWVYVFDGLKSNSEPASSNELETSAVETSNNDINESENIDVQFADNVVVLPKLQRPEEDNSKKLIIVRNPFATPYIVSGICYSNQTENYCIIEAEGASYVLKENESAGNLFKVIKIYEDRVTIRIEDKDIIIYKAEKE